MTTSLEKLLTRLAELQTDTAPITLTIGAVNGSNVVEHGIVYVSDAPPTVVKTIVSEFYAVSLDSRGLRIDARMMP